MEENLEEHAKSPAATFIFLIVVAFQFFSFYIENKKKVPHFQ